MNTEARTTAVEAAETTQSSMGLNKSIVNIYPHLVSEELQKRTASTVEKIDQALKDERQLGVRIGALLVALRGEFDAYFDHLEKTVPKYTAPSDRQIEGAFLGFLQVRFKIGDSRGREYMRLASRHDIKDFELPASMLVELTRLDEETLAAFLEEHPLSELQDLSCKEIKRLVREANPDSRERAKKTPSVKKLTSTLKTTFELVKENYGSPSDLPDELREVVVHISEWASAKKSKAKKAA